jgi:integrase
MQKTKLNKPKGSRFWKLFVEKDGKYKVIFKSESKQLVKKKRAEVQAQSIDTEALLNKKTFVNLYEEFALYKIEEANQPLGPRPHSVKNYMCHFRKWIKPYFNDKILLNEVTIDVAEKFFKKIYDKGASWITANNVVKTFQTALRYAKQKQYISSIGQMEDFKPKKRTSLKAADPEEMERKETPMITLQEANRLLKVLYPKDNHITDIRNFTIASVFVFCGLRMSELRGLRWHNIALGKEDIITKQYIVGKLSVKDTIVGSVQGYGKTKAARRTFIIHPFLDKALKIWHRVHYSQFQDRTSYVFPSLGHYQDIIVPVCERTIRDFLNIAYGKLGLAKVKLVARHDRADDKRVVVEHSKFGKNPTRTFRHFSSTSLCDAQAANPVLTDNFIKNYQGHENIELTKGLYGNHLNRDASPERLSQEVQALANAIPINWEEISQ